MTTTTPPKLTRQATSSPFAGIGLPRIVLLGAFSGMAAAMVMAMFAMVASVTYQHHGFFTPLFHISVLVGSPASMIASVRQAMTGHAYWFTPGAALAGMIIHLMTGAMFGALFALIGRRVRRRSLVAAGALYGLGVFAFASIIGLPVAAAVTGSGDAISHMATTVGWTTFAIEHLMFGIALGVATSLIASRLAVEQSRTGS